MDNKNSIKTKVIGRSWVRGYDYLTDNLALSILTRQMEKKSGTHRHAKFLNNSIHFSRSDQGRQTRPHEDVPYDNIRKIYTFRQHPEVMMICVEGYEDYEMRMYESFRFENAKEMNRARERIQGDYHSHINYEQSGRNSSVFLTEPEVKTTVYQESQTPKSNYKTVVRSVSPVYRKQNDPVTNPSVQRVYYTGRRSSTPSVYHVDDQYDDDIVLKRVTRVIPATSK